MKYINLSQLKKYLLYHFSVLINFAFLILNYISSFSFSWLFYCLFVYFLILFFSFNIWYFFPRLFVISFNSFYMVFFLVQLQICLSMFLIWFSATFNTYSVNLLKCLIYYWLLYHITFLIFVNPLSNIIKIIYEL